MSSLRKIADYVQNVAEVIASALKVEVEIIDDQHFRVGGANELKSELGRKQKWGYVNEYVLRTGQHFIITDPGYHQLCESCELKGNCYCKIGVFSPIELRGSTIGIISLMGFTEEQKETLTTNSKYYMDFIARMADMLASKVSERQVMEDVSILSSHLQAIINSVNYGIISINNQGRVVCFNQAAGKVLGINNTDVTGRLIGETVPDSPLSKVLATGEAFTEQQIKYTRVPSKALVVSNVYPIFNGKRLVGAVETIRDYAEVQKLIYKFDSGGIRYTFDNIIGCSPELHEIKAKAEKVAQSKSTVLIEGESGTGKELFARAIHATSPCSNGPFVAINCSAIPDTLLESELFGYDKGAFTGAKQGGKLGKFELADSGTLFLDEIGDMPLYLQSKLLRVLQERVVQRLGSTKEVPINVRVISATNQNISKKVESGEFRKDLYYRLNVIPLYIPPLRERKEDIPLLLEHYLAKYNNILKKRVECFSQDAMRLMIRYNWPGNVRELENTIEYTLNLALGQIIEPPDLPVKIPEYQPEPTDAQYNASDYVMSTYRPLKQNSVAERQALLNLLQKYGSSVKQKDRIAEMLGISRATLYRKLRNLGLTHYRSK